jgi:hypothetical protein
MDPNATLQELRELTEQERIGGDGSHAERICELFDALDGWISKGGFLPADWIGVRGQWTLPTLAN